MKKFERILIAIVTFTILWIGTVLFVKNAHAVDVPGYNGYVNDYAEVLSDQQETALENKISEYDKQTTNQIAILTIKSLEGQDIRDFGIKVFDNWKVGQADKDNGVIFIVVVDDHKMSIEVGTGLEGDLTDIESKHIMDDDVAPHFKRDDFYMGIDTGTNAIIHNLTPDYTVSEATGSAETDEASAGGVVLFIIIVIIIIIFLAAMSDSGFGGGFGTGLGTGFIIGSSSDDDDDNTSSGGSKFGGGSSSGGGASSSW